MKFLTFFLLFLLNGTILSQNITISKDSLWVSNNIAFSKDDALTLSNPTNVTLKLDSAV